MNSIFSRLTTSPKRTRFFVIIITLGVVLLVGFVFIVSNFNIDNSIISYRERFVEMGDDWTITIDGAPPETHNLPYWVDAPSGTTFTLSRTLPAKIMPYETLVIRNHHMIVSAYIDGELIYQFPEDGEKLSGTIITDDWCMIPIEEFYANKVITISYATGMSEFAGNITAPILGEDNSIIAALRSKYALPYGLAVGLALIGFMLIVVAAVYTKDFAEKSHLLLGVVFIVIGIWFSDRSKMPVFMVGSNIKFFMAFLGLVFAPLLIALYTGERFIKHNQLVANLMITLDALFAIIILAVLGGRIAPIHRLVVYVYIAILISIVYALYLMWYYSHGKGSKQLNRVQLNSSRMEFLSVMLLLAGSFLSVLWDAVSSNNYSSSQRDWTGIGNIQMVAVMIFAFFQLIILLYNGYYTAIESEATQKKLHDSQLQLMMGQIQPHFMFNTLSSIRTLIKIDPDTAYSMTYDFSNYLRANVDNLTNLGGISFDAEVQHIQSYVGIEKVRFGDRLEVDYDLQETGFMVPPLSIQPLVENAIKHGVMKKMDGGKVWLRSYETADSYIVEVEDNGVGIPKEKLDFILGHAAHPGDVEINLTGNGSETHVSSGMKNIIMRLDEITKAHLEVTSFEGRGTLMKVTFPKDSQPAELTNSEDD